MSRYDATQSNESTRSSRIYKDLNLNFEKNTVTKDIQKNKILELLTLYISNISDKPQNLVFSEDKIFGIEAGMFFFSSLLFILITTIISIMLTEKIQQNSIYN